MTKPVVDKQSTGASTALETSSKTHSFTSPQAIPTLDQIPVPVLKLLVSLGPTLRLAARWVSVLQWQSSPRDSFLVVLIWICLCLWTWPLLTFGLPCLILYQLSHHWLSIRTLRKKREALEKKRQEQPPEHDESEDEDKLQQIRKVQAQDELISRKIQHEDHVSLDDTLQDIQKVNQFVESIRHQPSMTQWLKNKPVVFVLTVLMYACPVWWVVCYLLGVHGVLAVMGACVLLKPSGYVQLVLKMMQENAILRQVMAALWAYGVACITTVFSTRRRQGWKSRFAGFFDRAKQQKSIALDTLTSKSTEDQDASRTEMIFQFEVYENQRWWLGVNWTTNMMPSERAPWTDNQMKPISSKEDVQLPEATVKTEKSRTINKIWSWADGDWWVDMTGELQNKVDHNGWEYGNNAWKQTSGTPGIQTFTRRRRWCRRAKLVEREIVTPHHDKKNA
ncbi:peroxisome- protein [Rhizopus stolonifer]|uniref:Peroxisome-protein n=1 Tax=Rhizopus stolonifer TaxID=4846 RepID=A0A367KTR5_RHIST|nr:peroxisome- protein [Rhizopus stolonifer]